MANYRGVNLYRPNRVQGVPLTQGRSVIPSATTGNVQYINYNAVQLPAAKNAAGAYQPPFGNMSRNPGRTPPLYQLDLDLNKNFNLPKEGMKLEFRSEFYNIFNHTNLYLPSTISGTQGANASTGGLNSSTFTPRVVQFALKLNYSPQICGESYVPAAPAAGTFLPRAVIPVPSPILRGNPVKFLQ